MVHTLARPIAFVLLAAVLAVPCAAADGEPTEAEPGFGSPVCGYNPGTGLGVDQGTAPTRVGVRTPVAGVGVIIYLDGSGSCIDGLLSP